MISRKTFALATTLVFAACAALGWYLQPARGRQLATASGADVASASATDTGGDSSRVVAPAHLPPADWVESNPRASGYDAIRAGQVLDLSASALFDREPRQPTWAAAMEADQRATLERALNEVFDDASVDELECRTSTCRIVVAVESADLEAMIDLLQVYVTLGEIVSYSVLDDGPGPGHVQWNVAFGSERRTLAALDAHVRQTDPTLERRRKAWIDAHRATGGR